MANPSGKRKSPQSPPPSQSPSGEEASSRGSAQASDSEPLVGDPGPAFDPESPPPAPEQPPLAAAEILQGLPEWEEEVIANLLGLKGRVLHAVAGVTEEDWIYTELDLAAIVPPLVRILNRYEPTRRYAGHADPIMVAFGVGGYGLRSLIERQQALAAEEPPETEVPIAPADTGSGPVPPPAPPPGPGAPPPPPPPAPRAASSLPATSGRRSAGATAPPSEPSAPVELEDVEWERG